MKKTVPSARPVDMCLEQRGDISIYVIFDKESGEIIEQAENLSDFSLAAKYLLKNTQREEVLRNRQKLEKFHG